MISLYLSVSGGQLASELANDPEEMACALKELTEWDGAELGEQVAEYMYVSDAAEVAAFLRGFLEKIEAVAVL